MEESQPVHIVPLLNDLPVGPVVHGASCDFNLPAGGRYGYGRTGMLSNSSLRYILFWVRLPILVSISLKGLDLIY